ncbi:MAG: GAF domain-containing sensor histidine kinase [bacterium]|nr:GAF domain-containing sensor histidine kinase [bacterium]
MVNNYSTSPETKNVVLALWRLQKIILDTLDFNEVVQKICDGLLTELGYLDLGYRIIVLTLIDEEKGVLKRISLSQTGEAAKAQEASAVPFHDIEIPLSAKNNLLVKAIKEMKPCITHCWTDIFAPILTPEQAFANQTAAGIETSMIYPVVVRDKAIGALIFSMVKEEQEVSEEEKELITGFTEIVGLAVQNSKLYSALDKANTRLKELDKKKDEFVSVASHELRTPMTAIRSYLWLALAGKGGELTEKQKYYLDRSYNSTVRLIKLVNDMLNVSRIESGRLSLEMTETDIKKLVEDSVAEVKPKADELGINIILKYDGEKLPNIQADVDKVKEVVINLVGNSLKFTPRGGNIIVWSEVKDNMVITHVADTGQGLEPDDLPKLFQKFSLMAGSYVTNQNAAQGTGLGLYICREILKIQDGEIWVESEGRGKGATFSFSLKIANGLPVANKDGLGIIHTTLD